MKTTLIVPALVLLAVLAADWPAGRFTAGQAVDAAGDAASPQPPAKATPVAVIDVARVFKNHREFQHQLEKLRGEAEEIKKQVAVRQAEIGNVQKRLQSLQPGSVQGEDTQLLLARLQAELKLYAEREQQQLLHREAVLYADTYEELTDIVGRYARAHGIRLVIRTAGDDIDPANRKSVLGGVNRLVVYQEGLDITDAVLAELNAAGKTQPQSVS
jgi:Skp family chaperone for outer membrane proteins